MHKLRKQFVLIFVLNVEKPIQSPSPKEEKTIETPSRRKL